VVIAHDLADLLVREGAGQGSNPAQLVDLRSDLLEIGIGEIPTAVQMQRDLARPFSQRGQRIEDHVRTLELGHGSHECQSQGCRLRETRGDDLSRGHAPDIDAIGDDPHQGGIDPVAHQHVSEASSPR
jgi:hypothetical protein